MLILKLYLNLTYRVSLYYYNINIINIMLGYTLFSFKIYFLSSFESLCEVLWKHSVHMHVTILRAWSKAHSIWGECYWMDSTEMTLDTCELFVVDYVV